MNITDEFTTPLLYSDEDASESEYKEHRILNDAANGAWFNPSSRYYRFIILILMCAVGSSIHFCYDIPGALQNYFIVDMGMTYTQYTWLYSIYSWPNVVLSFVGGFLIDRVFGNRFGMILYMFISMTGQLVFALGLICDAYWMMLFGRFLFGSGAESLGVAQDKFAVQWFKGKELNLAFGLRSSLACIGSTANFFLMEPIYKYVNQWYTGHMCLGIVVLISCITCILSFTSAILLSWFDKRAERILQRKDNTTHDVVKLSDVKNLSASFWMISIICLSYSTSIVPFVNVGKMFFMQKFGLSKEDSNYINSLPYILAIFACPLFGYIVDITGKNLTWLSMSVVTTMISLSFIAFTNVNPYVCMISLGLASTLLSSSVMPLIALIIPEHHLGIAFGVSLAISNIYLALVSLLSGVIVDHTSYFTLDIFLVCALGATLIVTLCVWSYDRNRNGILNMTSHERELHLASRNVNEKTAAYSKMA